MPYTSLNEEIYSKTLNNKPLTIADIREESEDDIIDREFSQCYPDDHKKQAQENTLQHNVEMIEKWHDKWLDPDYKFYGY
jgi:hypothetical protein